VPVPPVVDPRLDPGAVARAAEVLRAGGLVAFPTETVYGLGADATDVGALERVFAVKARPAEHPLIVHLPDGEPVDRWATEVPPAARRLAEACWPGPLTLVLRRGPALPAVVAGGRATVGLRVPAHPVALELLGAFGGPVAAPSANRFGHVSPTTAGHVADDLDGDVDLILDGGPCAVGVESTIVDLTVDPPEVLRPGAIGLERLATVLGGIVVPWRGERDVAASGTLAAHYQPTAQVELCTAGDAPVRARARLAEGRSVGVLAPVHLPTLPDDVVELEPAGDSDGYARVLYDRLRQADRVGLDHLLVVPPPAEGVGIAVRDRLARAAGPRGDEAGGRRRVGPSSG
jgi:L-threonylcarbamoyladenylate synthase